MPGGRFEALTVRVLVQSDEVTEKVTAEILPPRVTDWVRVGALLVRLIDIEHTGLGHVPQLGVLLSLIHI